jgi:hypothetical protein
MITTKIKNATNHFKNTIVKEINTQNAKSINNRIRTTNDIRNTLSLHPFLIVYGEIDGLCTSFCVSQKYFPLIIL